MRSKLTEDDRQTILQALGENEGKIKQTHRELKAAGTPYGYGSVSNIAKDAREEESVQSRLIASEARVRSLQSTNTYLRKLLGDSLRISDEILGAVPILPVPKRIKLPKDHVSDTETPACSPIADWHIGEQIDEGEVEGFNAFNYAIAERRVDFLADKVAKWVLTERHGHKINELHVPIMGDMITGNIHDELIAYAEFPLPEAVVKASHLISRFLTVQAGIFPNVVVHQLKVDNHSRLTKKKGSKHRGTNSWNHVIGELCRQMLRDHKNVKWISHDAQKAEVDIAGQRYLADHGDSIRAYMGLPYYGFAREDGREALKRMRVGKRFDDRLRAHWHVAGAGPLGIQCGCLCGSTELDAQSGRFSDPFQVSFLVHPKYGWFNFTRWNLKDA
ncbi:hypothetical protein LCGC14_0236140 [marine sediment metagenome]|uniref:Uncharacterized protein n=1 Tax=marine sediment metagenome TaxID=412755 RepID=A0A0F9XDD2_9ZZZZ